MLTENESFPWDRRIRLQAETLQSAGYQVSVICPKGEDQDFRSYEEIGGVHVYRYPFLREAKGGALGYLLEYGWALLCTLLLGLFVWMRDGVDIVHSANPPDLFFLFAWPLRLCGKKYVFDEHDLSPELYDSKFHRHDWMYRALFHFQRWSYYAADLVISTNESYRAIARERGGLTERRQAVVRNGPPDGFERVAVRPELKEGFPHMAVYLGVMGRQDGVDRVLHAAQRLLARGRHDLLFVLIGKGECWEALRVLAGKLHVTDIVRFPGRISDELLLEYLSTADVCLAPDPPDRMNQLSTMTKIMEYMACERPIVSFDLLETRRSAGESAVYVEKDDPAMFADALSTLVDNPKRRDSMGRLGRERVNQFVGWPHSAKALLEAYSRLRPSLPLAVASEISHSNGS